MVWYASCTCDGVCDGLVCELCVCVGTCDGVDLADEATLSSSIVSERVDLAELPAPP